HQGTRRSRASARATRRVRPPSPGPGREPRRTPNGRSRSEHGSGDLVLEDLVVGEAELEQHLVRVLTVVGRGPDLGRRLVELHRVRREPELAATREGDLLEVAVRDRLRVVVQLDRRLQWRPHTLEGLEPLAPLGVRAGAEDLAQYRDALGPVLVARRAVLEAR